MQFHAAIRWDFIEISPLILLRSAGNCAATILKSDYDSLENGMKYLLYILGPAILARVASGGLCEVANVAQPHRMDFPVIFPVLFPNAHTISDFRLSLRLHCNLDPLAVAKKEGYGSN
jgi:hypothetical protein